MIEVDIKEVILRNAYTDLINYLYALHTLHLLAAAGDLVLLSLNGVAQGKVTNLTRRIKEQDIDRGTAGTTLHDVQWNSQTECWIGHWRRIGFRENLDLRCTR